jgi:hypothetical protein
VITLKFRTEVSQKSILQRAARVSSRSRWQGVIRKETFDATSIVLLLLFGGGGGYYGYSRWGTGGGLGIVGTVLLIAVVLYLLGVLR